MLSGLQVTAMLSALHHTRSLATSALPDAPVVPDDDRRSSLSSPGRVRRGVAVALRRSADRLAPVAG
jgi:hypothetical protein